MKHDSNPCRPWEHAWRRREFLGAFGALAASVGMPSLSGLRADDHPTPAIPGGKRLILIYLGGGASQFETWDPKPRRPTGGPFDSIETSVPGVRISELLPRLATRMGRLATIRSVDNSEIGPDHHGSGLHVGRRNDPAVRFPTLAEIATKELTLADTRVPPSVELQVADTFRYETEHGMSMFGAQYAPLVLTGGNRPPDTRRQDNVTAEDQLDRETLRDFLSKRFEERRRGLEAESYSRVLTKVNGLMSCEALFDVERAPLVDLARYGPSPLGRHCLLARRLIEAGVSVVKIRDTWWDTHADNFEGHRGKCANLDQAFATLLDDLADRGMLETTLVATLSEFGRTPTISAELGRDHFPKAWSVVAGGCGIHGGALVGKTSDNGDEVVERRVTPADLFATYFKALGIDPRGEYFVGDRPIPRVDSSGNPIEELFS